MTSQNPIRWKRGEFHTFIAVLKVRVGGKQEITINEGDEFEYDGSVCKYAGDEFPQPQLRGAIKQGWAVPDGEVDEDAHVPDAHVTSRKIAKSQSVNKDLRNVQRHEPQPMETDHYDEDTVLNVGDRAAVRDGRSGNGHLTARHNRRTAAAISRGPEQAPAGFMQVTQSDIDEQDGVVVSPIKTRANLGKIDVTRADSASITRTLANASHEDGYGKFGGPRKSNIVTREGVQIATNVGTMDRGASIDIGDEDQGVEVGRVRHSSNRTRSEEGVAIEDTGRSKARGVPHKAQPKAKARPKMTVSKPAARAKIPEGASPKLRIAMKVHSDFPEDWNFYAKTDEKLARVGELGANPDLLDALYASESNSMKKTLESRYPEHFKN